MTFGASATTSFGGFPPAGGAAPAFGAPPAFGPPAAQPAFGGFGAPPSTPAGQQPGASLSGASLFGPTPGAFGGGAAAPAPAAREVLVPTEASVRLALSFITPERAAEFVLATPSLRRKVDAAFAAIEEDRFLHELLGRDVGAPPLPWQNAASTVNVPITVPPGLGPGSKMQVGRHIIALPACAVPGSVVTVQVPGETLRRDTQDIAALRPGQEEFDAVAAHFALRGGGGFQVHEVYRLRNMSLHARYSGSVKAVAARHGGVEPLQRLLFHGGSGWHHMFLSAVAVGSSCTGRKSMKRPDLREGSTTVHHDTAVDDVDDPSIFVVFESGATQVLPLYVVAYTSGGGGVCAPRALQVCPSGPAAEATLPLLAFAAEADARNANGGGGGGGLLAAMLQLPGVDVDFRGPSAYTALHACAERGWGDQVQLLLAQGADPCLRVGMGSRDAAKVGKTPSELPPALSGLTAALNAAHATRLASDARAVSSAFARAEHFSFDLLEPDDADVELTFEQRYEQEYLHAKHDGASAKSAASCADEADFHVREFLRFLALKSVRPDVTPSVVVDNVFHLALTYTVAYAHLCALVGGTFIHHDPTPGGDAANARYMRQYEDALELYALAFGAPPPRSVWPPVAERMDPQRDYVSLPRSRVQELRAAAMKSNIIGGVW
ncbi:phenylacetate-CoA ligase [Aureococcus anophagefferens]|nr:phenylacetate-CoA ligase [Aureococcus anophagefferens]